MSYSVKWTDLAIDDLAEMLQYVDVKYGVDAALNLNDEVERFTDLVAKCQECFLNSNSVMVSERP